MNSHEANWALAPYLDCLNHSSVADITASSKNDKFEIITNRKISKNEEVFISYGKHPDAFLLIEYGFAIGQSNSFNSVAISSQETLFHSEVKRQKCLEIGCNNGYAITENKGKD